MKLPRLVLLAAAAAFATTTAGCKKSGAGPDDGIDPDAGYDATIPDPDAKGMATLALAGGFTASYACTTSSSFDTSGGWKLEIIPTDSPGSVTFGLSVTSASALAAGQYTFDSAAVGTDSFVGLTIFEATIRSWNAQKGDATIPRAGSLTLDLTDPGTTAAAGPERPPHGSVSAVMVSDQAGLGDVMVTGSF